MATGITNMVNLSYNFGSFDTAVLKQKNINLKKFDKNHNNKIDRDELRPLLKAGKTSHVSQLMNKTAVKAEISTLEKKLAKLDKGGVKKWASIAGALGGASGFMAGMAAVGGASLITNLSVGAAVAGPVGGALMFGVGSYFIAKNLMNGYKKGIEQELAKYKQTLNAQ